MSDSTPVDFALMQQQLAALTGSEPDPLANAANFVALLFHGLAGLNWVGIYALRDQAGVESMCVSFTQIIEQKGAGFI